MVKAIEDLVRLVLGRQFDKAVHSLASAALHNDVDGLETGTFGLSNDVGCAANGRDDLIFERAVGYLFSR